MAASVIFFFFYILFVSIELADKSNLEGGFIKACFS